MSFFKIIIDTIGIFFQVILTVFFFNLIWKNYYVKNNLIVRSVVIIIFCLICILYDNHLIRLSVNFILIIYISFFYKINKIERLMYSTIIFVIFAISEMFTGLSLSIITKETVSAIARYNFTYFMGAFVSKLVTIIIIKLVSLFKKNTHKSNNKFTIGIIFYPASSFIISIILYLIVYNVSNLFVIILCEIAVAIITIANISLFYIIEKQSEYEFKEQQREFIEKQLESQIQHYKELSKSQMEIRKMWHDMKNNFTIINGLLKNNEIKTAQNYIYEVIGNKLFNKHFVNTSIPALDAILTSKIAIADEFNIAINHKILIEQTININQMDLGIIVANALDNAIEAISNNNLEDRNIKFKIIDYNNFISIVIENPCTDNMDINRIETTKIDKLNHGFGLKGIRSLAIKYGGDMDIEISNGIFKLSVILKNEIK